jgi:O-antigen/teichoic acid export membrane protein
MLPRMSSLVAEGNLERFKYLLDKSSNILFSYSIPFVLLFIVYAPEIINIYAGKGFEGAILPMQISMPLMIIIGYEQIIITQGLLPLDKNKSVLVNAIIGAVVGVVLSFIIVGKLKSVGSTLVWAISEICVLLSASIFISKYLHYKFPLVLLLKELISYTPLLPILLYMHNIFDSSIMDILLGGMVAILYTFIVQRFIFRQKELVEINDLVIKLLRRNSKI